MCVFVNNFCSYQCTNLDDHKCCTLSHPRSNYTSSNTSVHPSSNFQLKYAYLQVSSSAQLLGCQDPSDEPSTLPASPCTWSYVLYCPTVQFLSLHTSRRPTISAVVHITAMYIYMHMYLNLPLLLHRIDNHKISLICQKHVYVHCSTLMAQEDLNS